MDLENFYITPCFSHDYHLTLVEYGKQQNTQSVCTTTEKETDRDTFFLKKNFHPTKKIPCYQDTGLGCPVTLLAGFPSKVEMIMGECEIKDKCERRTVIVFSTSQYDIILDL